MPNKDEADRAGDQRSERDVPSISESLLSQTSAAGLSDPWCRDAFSGFASRVTEADFPCVFAKNAFRRGIVKFIFVDATDRAGVQHLAKGLKAFVQISRCWDGDLEAAYPLAVLFSPEAVHARDVEGYHLLGWRIMQDLHDLDPAPWPDEVGVDPDFSDWSMCFDGMPLFFNMSHPRHVARRSRNLGDCFTFIINPRDRFDVFAGDNHAGRKIRETIRRRVLNFDGIPHSTQLGMYGKSSLEWWQYGLIDTNEPRTDKCPFSVKDQKRDQIRTAKPS